jgi:hypothetical protein
MTCILGRAIRQHGYESTNISIRAYSKRMRIDTSYTICRTKHHTLQADEIVGIALINDSRQN